ncbi:MAG: hypothetical protein JO322_13525 [Candidatus Eremiobacteraeota bacterium]|nr:hypothetical protein [Candidatus Eremiobacteraeota bacterium]
MIEAYAMPPSVAPGERVTVCIRSDRATTMCVFRAGSRPERMREYALTPVAAGDQRLEIEIPGTWRSGIYVVVLQHPHEVNMRLDARDARALLVVRPRLAQSPMLYNVPLFTYHAYNVGQAIDVDGTCLYNTGKSVSMERCGGGIGGHLWDERNVDVYDPSSPRQSFAHWDARAIAWLERNRYDLDYCCDLDLHRNPSLLSGYRLLLAFGHHEYWTMEMRAHLDAFIERGGNAAFFTGNTCFFRAHYDDATQRLSRFGRWCDDPEERTFGVSYRFGGGKWIGGRPPTGFCVERSHWIFEQCPVRTGDVFGEEERIIGYECDGSPVSPPPGFTALAQASIAHWPVHDGSGEINEGARATLGVLERGGTLFTAGTVDWARALGSSEPTVVQITSNVINRLSLS